MDPISDDPTPVSLKSGEIDRQENGRHPEQQGNVEQRPYAIFMDDAPRRPDSHNCHWRKETESAPPGGGHEHRRKRVNTQKRDLPFVRQARSDV